MKKIRLFVYDFDGTLVDSKLDIADSVNCALRDLGVRELPRETIFGYIGNGVESLLTHSLAGASASAGIQEAVEAFKKHYDRRLLDQTNFYPNCRETLDFFSHKTHAIFSNKPLRFIKRILEGLNFLHPFASIVGGDSLKSRKPDPQGLLHILETLRISPGETLMVGDSATDVETGRRAKVFTCAVTYGLGDRKSLDRARPDWIIDNFAQLRELFC